jgi:hypothetical protein
LVQRAAAKLANIGKGKIIYRGGKPAGGPVHGTLKGP